MSARPALVALGVLVLAVGALLGWSRFAPYGMSTAEAEAAVRAMRGVDAEFFYLGEEVDGLRLAEVVDPGDGGRLIFEYGRCMDHDEGGCNRPLNVLSVAAPYSADDSAATSTPCVREVLGRGNEVLIGGSRVEIVYWRAAPYGYDTDFGRSRALVPQLRAVGEPAPSDCGEPAS
jgi:hypothetical protein